MNLPSKPFSPPKPARPGGFTLIELLAVIGIILVLVALTIPAVKSLSKSNDQSQSVNLVRAMIANARSIAISRHTPAGVVFFEETAVFSSPVNGGQTAMQIFVERYDQSPSLAPGLTEYVYYSSDRQYLPANVRIAALTDSVTNVEAGDTTGSTASSTPARAILFDANGQLVLRGGLSTDGGALPGPGRYPTAYGDWQFLARNATATGASSYNSPGSVFTNAYTSPGFFLYNKGEYDAQPPLNRTAWLTKNASVVIVNPNTGGVLR